MIVGTFVNHPMFAGEPGHTSFVVKHDENTGEIETRNSKYTLVREALDLAKIASDVMCRIETSKSPEPRLIYGSTFILEALEKVSASRFDEGIAAGRSEALNFKG